jgi:hypothetical protein
MAPPVPFVPVLGVVEPQATPPTASAYRIPAADHHRSNARRMDRRQRGPVLLQLCHTTLVTRAVRRTALAPRFVRLQRNGSDCQASSELALGSSRRRPDRKLLGGVRDAKPPRGHGRSVRSCGMGTVHASWHRHDRLRRDDSAGIGTTGLALCSRWLRRSPAGCRLLDGGQAGPSIQPGDSRLPS